MTINNFSLPDENGAIHNLSDYKGKWVVLYFYPKDDTPGCTKEACSFRDSIADLTSMGTVVMGVSRDNQQSHIKFKEKYHLNFPLLSDIDGKVSESFKVGKLFGSRKTFLIDPNQNLAKEYDKVDVVKHAAEIMRDIQQLSS